MRTLSVTEVARHFADYVNRVAYRNESFVLRKGKRAVAELRPVPSGRALGDLPQLLASLPRLTEKEADSFAKDLSLIRKGTSKEKLKDPWQS